MKDETCKLNERIEQLEERLVIAATSVTGMIESLNQRLEDALRRIAEIETKQWPDPGW
jgi:hypothetical protein